MKLRKALKIFYYIIFKIETLLMLLKSWKKKLVVKVIISYNFFDFLNVLTI